MNHFITKIAEINADKNPTRIRKEKYHQKISSGRHFKIAATTRGKKECGKKP